MSESNDKWPYKPDKETLIGMALTMGLRMAWRKWRKRRARRKARKAKGNE